MSMRYPHVSNPIALGPVQIANRFYSSPHAMPVSLGGRPTDDYLHYNAARAKGGVGLIMLSLTIPERSAGAQPRPNVRENIPAFRAVADAVHAEGAKIFGEPFYQWCATGSWQFFGPQAPALGPSASQFGFLDRRSATRQMTRSEIQTMVREMASATANLREAGFDGIMLHASHAALLEQFLSPYYNRRDDEYGGSLENRMRLMIESLQAVRDAAGPDMAVGIRLNCDELLSGGYGTEEAGEVLGRLSGEDLIDFADLDIAIEPDQFHLGMPPVFVEPHVYAPYVAAVRGAAGKVPVLSVLGRLTSIADAEAAIASGLCDMVGAARALIAEPNLVRNALEGNEDRSRTCIACNACLAGFLEGVQACAINPVSYRERVWSADVPSEPARRSKVVVVGGGPAGLEAARTSALQGHEVVLLEAREELGGGLDLWARLPGRAFYSKAIEWWARELERLGVTLRLGRAADAADILAMQPDAVIIATGALYSAEGRSHFRDFPIPVSGDPRLCTPEDILLGKVTLSGKVVVLDAEGTHAGTGVAELLAGQGVDVEFLTPYFAPTSARLADTQDAHFIVKRLLQQNVKLSCSSYVARIEDRRVIACNVHTDEERAIDDVDAVVLATGRLPRNDLERALDGKVAQLFTVGDALAPRVWSAAAYEGHKFARLIGVENGPPSQVEVYFAPDDPAFALHPADLARLEPAGVR